MNGIIPFLTTLALAIIWQAQAAPGDVILKEVSHQAEFQLETVVDTLDSPWSLDFLPDGRMIVTEWSGNVRLVKGSTVGEPLAGLPPVLERNGRTGGRLSVSVHPNFETNGLVYLCSLFGDYQSNVTQIIRGKLHLTELQDVEVIFEGNDRAEEFHHNGCRFIWEDERTLLATFGDRRHLPDESQNLATTTGTIIRLRDDGSIPGDNPFTTEEEARKEVFAYGVRNVQGIAKHPETGQLWFCEHGPLGGDEINVLAAGANYGWPIATYGIDYDETIITDDVQSPGVVGPLVYWRPSTAPSGLDFYTGKHFPKWRGDLFMGSLMDQAVIRMELHGDQILFQEKLMLEIGERIRDVRMGPDGYLYIVTDASPGGIYRVIPMDNIE